MPCDARLVALAHDSSLLHNTQNLFELRKALRGFWHHNLHHGPVQLHTLRCWKTRLYPALQVAMIFLRSILVCNYTGYYIYPYNIDLFHIMKQ